jgi:hypothetical protein
MCSIGGGDVVFGWNRILQSQEAGNFAGKRAGSVYGAGKTNPGNQALVGTLASFLFLSILCLSEVNAVNSRLVISTLERYLAVRSQSAWLEPIVWADTAKGRSTLCKYRGEEKLAGTERLCGLLAATLRDVPFGSAAIYLHGSVRSRCSKLETDMRWSKPRPGYEKSTQRMVSSKASSALDEISWSNNWDYYKTRLGVGSGFQRGNTQSYREVHDDNYCRTTVWCYRGFRSRIGVSRNRRLEMSDTLFKSRQVHGTNLYISGIQTEATFPNHIIRLSMGPNGSAGEIPVCTQIPFVGVEYCTGLADLLYGIRGNCS